MQKIFKIFDDDAIVAPSTPAGSSAIAVIRGSGKNIVDVFQKGLKISPSIANAKPNYSTVVKINIDDFFDRAVITIFESPKSYTGEDMVELSVHGNPVLVRIIIGALIAGGARLAKPGEFTLRAAINGKMNLIEAESVYSTVAAQTERALKASRRTIANIAEIEKSRRIIHNILIELVAALEFSEDSFEKYNFSIMQNNIENAKELLLKFIYRAQKSKKLSSGITVAIAGETNAGKSTLFNRIVGAERAIVTPHPGTTRDVIEATVEIAGVPIKILDTAGIRESEHPVEIEGIRRAKNAAQNADIVLWLIDVSNLEGSLPVIAKNYIIVLNKSDMGIRPEILKRFDDAVTISALRGNGFDSLILRIEEQLSEIPADALLASERTIAILRRTAEELETVLDAMDKNFWDVAQVSLERANSAIDSLFSPKNNSDIYDEIFKKFCIGK